MKLLNSTFTIDPGIGGTGWAYWHNSTVPKSTGVIKPRRYIGEDAWIKKSLDIWNDFKIILDFYASTTAYIEFPDLWSGSAKSQSAAGKGDLFKLSYLIGGLALEIKRAAIDIKIIHPIKWKGQMSKEVVDRRIYRAIHRRYQEHTSDAVGIGLHLMGTL